MFQSKMHGEKNHSGQHLTVIIDTDAGIDDSWAILMLLASAKQNQLLNVAGITCVYGNTDVTQTCVNVLRTLESANRMDIPVFKGASSSLVGSDENFKKTWKPFFGADGFGCAVHEKTPDYKLISDENGIVALNRIVNENKGNVSLLCFGPLTNVALAIRTYPNFEGNLKEILIMGGNYKAVGNTTNCAEFNFHADPEAASIVLNSAVKHKMLLPWETCCQMAFALDWRDNVLGVCDSPCIQLMNRVERPLRSKASFVDWVACDQVVAAVLLEPAVATRSEKAHLTVELHGQHTRGQVVVAHKFKQEPNTTLVKEVDKDLLAQLLLNIHSL